MSVLLTLLPLLPLVAGGLIAVFGWRMFTAWAAPITALAIIGLGAAFAADVLDNGPATALGGQLRVDPLSCLMLILIGAVAAITSAYGIAYLRTELEAGTTTPRRARLYGVLVQVTVAAMTVVVTADNLGVMWVAIEITTLATVLLIGHRRDRASAEAAWKYLVLGSVGVATALLGTSLVYFVARHGGGNAEDALSWSRLIVRAPQLDADALRVAIGLVVVGFGTKAGLAPLHSWLPDAYSQAPAPAAGLLAGAVSAMSMYALLRFKVIADLAIGDAFVRNLLLAAALSSLFVAASLMVTQRDYKRLLAYSSVEHFGLIALGVAIGSPLAVTAALLHMIGNGLAKSVAFSTSGEVLFLTGSTRISDVRGLLTRDRFVGTTFALSLVALAGLPPFSILASEIALFRSGIDDGLTWVLAIALGLMLVVFIALAIHGLNMMTGDADVGVEQIHTTTLTAKVPLVAGLIVAAATGVTIWPISHLLDAAAEVVAR